MVIDKKNSFDISNLFIRNIIYRQSVSNKDSNLKVCLMIMNNCEGLPDDNLVGEIGLPPDPLPDVTGHVGHNPPGVDQKKYF